MRLDKLCSSAAVLAVCVAMAPPSAMAGEKILYESDHVRFVEVTRWPGQSETVASPFPSVLAVDAAWPTLTETTAAGSAALHVAGKEALPPDGSAYPWCQSQAARSPHVVAVTGPFPQHYYRIDYKRIDGDDFSANWRKWYPWLLELPPSTVKDLGRTGAGTPYSKEWPYPIAYNALTAAPANHLLRYDDDHVQLLEVVIRPGERENMHGHPYPSVFADDGAGFTPVIEGQNQNLDPESGNPRGEMGPAPAGAKYPTCFAAVPEGPHAVTVTGTVPNHFYRIHFKRVDGEAIREKWREWYRE
jgi:hypothetical protein